VITVAVEMQRLLLAVWCGKCTWLLATFEQSSHRQLLLHLTRVLTHCSKNFNKILVAHGALEFVCITQWSELHIRNRSRLFSLL